MTLRLLLTGLAIAVASGFAGATDEPPAAFTPGPWYNQGRFRSIYALSQGDSGLTVFIAKAEAHQCGEAQADANANLIAASPDLLAACQAMVCMYQGYSAPGDLTPITLARAAIARALGQTPEGQ